MGRRPPKRTKPDAPPTAIPEGGRDVGRLLAGAFKAIRLRQGRTQEQWAEAAHMSQGWVSAVEKNAEGFDSVQRIADGLALAGVDPLDLFRVALAEADMSPVDAELYERLAAASDGQRGAVLVMLRTFAGENATAAGMPARR